MRAILCGANGAMGQLISGILGEEIVARVSIDGEKGATRRFSGLTDVDADIIIDFSHHTAVSDVLSYGLEHRCAVVIGTTGHDDHEKAQIDRAAREIPVFFSGNMSLGIAVLCHLAREAVRFFPDADVEIVETHHNRKVDAPSGTAQMLFHAIQQVRPNAVAHCGRTGEARRTRDEIGIHSLRMGNVVGIHEIHICTPSQILTLRHETGDRKMLAEGAVAAARFLLGKQAGLYNMNHLMEEM